KVALYMTSLEVLFATDATELAHKLSERIAWFVGRTPQERRETYSLLKRAYGVRSRIIHGDILSAQAQRDLKEVSALVDSLIRDVFRRLFDDAESRAIFGKPIAEMEEYFAGLVLGAAGPS